jgi:predicted NUDIX family phosphoesterase
MLAYFRPEFELAANLGYDIPSFTPLTEPKMSAVQTEQILVIPTTVFHKCGHFQGFSDDTSRYLHRILDPEITSYRPRDQMEQDPNFKQLIPYCIFRHTANDGAVSLFQYTRGKGQGESRLHAKCSLGIGGHISSLDAGGNGEGETAAASDSPYSRGMQRELDEEVTIGCDFDQHCVGLINDDQNEVGRVHLGVVHIFDVAEKSVTANEVEIEGAGFEPLSSILDRRDQFETWSQICLDALFSK